MKTQTSNKFNDLIIKKNDEVIKLKIHKKATRIGDSCHVLLPKGCEGKLFYIELKEVK